MTARTLAKINFKSAPISLVCRRVDEASPLQLCVLTPKRYVQQPLDTVPACEPLHLLTNPYRSGGTSLWNAQDEEVADTEEALNAGMGELSDMMVEKISQYAFILVASPQG
ncbi:MAG TPA: hypothetical protein VGO47_01775 [Chlamydiales bacterium]|nr:hypothetical protein [Chlamydiales bacterium]